MMQEGTLGKGIRGFSVNVGIQSRFLDRFWLLGKWSSSGNRSVPPPHLFSSDTHDQRLTSEFVTFF